VLAASVEYFEHTLGIDVDDVIARNEHEDQMKIIASWEDDSRRASLLLGDRVSGGTRTKTLTPQQINKTIFGQRGKKWR
jgi:hypothetical protein